MYFIYTLILILYIHFFYTFTLQSFCRYVNKNSKVKYSEQKDEEQKLN